MSTQLLIYERAVPVNKQRHKDWSVKAGKSYDFAKRINSVPLTAVELPSAAAEYGIIFAGNESAVMPAAILGVREQENLYVDDNGQWEANYLPAFIRRYPFVFSVSAEGDRFTLCIDEQFSGCNQEGIGEKLFDAEGERTQYLQNVLNFSSEYQRQFKRTQAFCKRLQELELLEPMQVQISLPSGRKFGLGGFQAVSRERLKKLSDEQLLALAKSDELELIYVHMHSLQNLQNLVNRIAARSEDSSAAAEESVPENATPAKEELH